MSNNNILPIVFTEAERQAAEELWSRCCTFLSTILSPSDMRNWISPAEARGIRENTLTLRVPTEAFAMYLEEHYMSQLKTMEQIYLAPNGTMLVFEYSTDTKVSLESALEVSSGKRNDRSINNYTNILNETLNFDTFIESECNRIPRSVGESVASRPGQAPFGVLFIHGPSGVGKTHLAQAIGQRVLMLHPDMRVCYVSCAKFEAQYSQDARFAEKASFLTFYQQMDVLIIDDIQGLVGKAKTQQAFFEIFNHLYLLNKQIILTCDVPPAQFEGIEERILTRLQASMKVELGRPDLELRRKIIQMHADKHKISISPEVVNHIANTLQSNIREIQGTMTTLLTHAQIWQKPIDIDFANSMMMQSVNLTKPVITLEGISALVAERFGIKIEDLRSSSRAKKYAHPRQIVMYLCCEYTELTLVSIAQKLKRKNHTTILHGHRTIKQMLEENADFRRFMDGLISELHGNKQN